MNTTTPKSVSRELISFNIEGGPNIDTLIDAFKYAYDPVVKIPITFVVAKSYTCPPGEPGCAYTPLENHVRHIIAIEHECGNNHSFNIRGSCRVALGKNRYDYQYDVSKKELDTNLVYANFTAYYNAKTRKGVISFYDFGGYAFELRQ